jgi:4-hydroxy-3-methylbut-2-enyl diphosphate reductase IspH
MPSAKRAIRVAGCSGGFSDRQRAIGDIAKNCEVDCIIGDWLSECTMTLHGAEKVQNEKLRAEGKLAGNVPGLFDPTFMENLIPALPHLKTKNIKLAVNAGASDTELLAKTVEEEVKRQGLDLKVGWINGDEVTETVKRLYENGEEFIGLMTGKPLKEWGYDILCAQ